MPLTSTTPGVSSPPMGWNSNNLFGGAINSSLIESITRAMVTRGFRAAGYVYVNLDNFWAMPDRVNGMLVPDMMKFPDGISGLAQYVHSNGMLMGIYADAGSSMCGPLPSFPGSLGFEGIDARTFALWGIDYLKYDNCYVDNAKDTAIARYSAMQAAIASTGRKMFFSICEWGCSAPWLWAFGIGNMWRVSGDINASFVSVMANADANNDLWSLAGPGGWNDPDMLEVGIGTMTTEEQRTHFSLWVIMKAPLILGCDVASISDELVAMLTNTNVIAVNQDSLGSQGSIVERHGSMDVWAAPLANGDVALLYVNRGDVIANGSTTLFGSVSAIDLWTSLPSPMIRTVKPHGCVFLRLQGPLALTRQKPPSQKGSCIEEQPPYYLLALLGLIGPCLAIAVMLCRCKLRISLNK